jgi:cytochrome c553
MRRLFLLLALIPPLASSASAPSGEHLVYTVGCVNCHHQTHKKIMNAPPLVIVKAYSLPQFRRLMKTGVTKTGRNMVAEGSVMGVVAQEQFSHFTDEEVEAIHGFLSTEWTAERGLEEEKKIPILFRKQIDKGELPPP